MLRDVRDNCTCRNNGRPSCSIVRKGFKGQASSSGGLRGGGLSVCMGVARIWEGGGQYFFFQIWKFACRRIRKAMRFARGVRGHATPRIFLKMVQFGAFWYVF